MQMQFDFDKHLLYDKATKEYTLDKEAFSADAEKYENSSQLDEPISNAELGDDDSEYEDDLDRSIY